MAEPASRLIGGWQINSIVTLQTGTPFTVTANDFSQTGGNHASRASCIGNPYRRREYRSFANRRERRTQFLPQPCCVCCSRCRDVWNVRSARVSTDRESRTST